MRDAKSVNQRPLHGKTVAKNVVVCLMRIIMVPAIIPEHDYCYETH